MILLDCIEKMIALCDHLTTTHNPQPTNKTTTHNPRNEVNEPIKVIICEYLGKLAGSYFALNKDTGIKFRVPYFYGIEKLKTVKIGDFISGIPHWKQFYLHPGTLAIVR